MKSLLAELSDPSREQPLSNSALAASLRGTKDSSSGLQDMAWRSLVPRKAPGTDRKLRNSGLYTVHTVLSVPAKPNKISQTRGIVSGTLRASIEKARPKLLSQPAASHCMRKRLT